MIHIINVNRIKIRTEANEGAKRNKNDLNGVVRYMMNGCI